MEPNGLRKTVVRKYAKILQVDTTNVRPASSQSASLNKGSPLSASQTGILERLTLTQRSAETILGSPKGTQSNHSIFKVLNPKAETITPLRLDSSLNNSQRLVTTHSENPFNTMATHADEKTSRRFEEMIARFTGPPSTRDGHNLTRSLSKSTHRDVLDSVCLTSPTNHKTRRTLSIYAEKESTIEDIYRGARGFGPELNVILNQEHVKKIRTMMKLYNVKDFGETQKLRVNNVITIIEKGFLSKEAKETKVKQDIWQIVTSELNKVRSAYDEFLGYFTETLEKVAKGKKKIYDQMKPWEALRFLVEQSFQTRQRKSGIGSGLADEDDLLQKVYQFKIDYRVSKDFNPKILQVYELVETHIKELNQLIEVERERYEIVNQQQEKILQEHVEQEKKQDVIKGEVLGIIQDWKKKEDEKGEKRSMLQEKHLQNHIDQLHEENLKLFEDNVQLKKDVKELKHEIRRMLAKEEKEKAAKVVEDKEIMVDLYSQSIQTEKVTGLSRYVRDLELSCNASVLPDSMVTGIMNMILTDKMITDMCDDYERRPRKQLGAYVTEWFLKRFGLHDFCQIIVPDFMWSIQTQEKGERGKVFQELLGTMSGQMGSSFRFSMDRHTQLDKNKLRKAMFGTSKMLKYFYKIIRTIKSAIGNTANVFFATHNYGPYLADLKQGREMMSLETAITVLNVIAAEEEFSAEEMKDFEDYLQIWVKKPEGKETRKELEDEEENEKGEEVGRMIDFDMFVRFMLEAVLEKHLRGFEKYFTSIKTHVLTKRNTNVTYDEYAASVNKINPEASQAWKDHSYALLMGEKATNEIPLFLLVENLVDCYFDEDKANEVDPRAQTEREFKNTTESDSNSARGPKQKIKKITMNKNQASQFQAQAQVVKNGSANAPNINSLRYRLGPLYKEGMALGNPGLNELGYEMYDCVSSLTVLFETYSLVEDSIRAVEKKDESITPLLEAFVKDLEALPKPAIGQESIDALLLFPKDELVDMLEYLWGRLRCLLVQTFRAK